MHELEIIINLPEPTVLLGVRGAKLKIIRQSFPKLKLVARGNSLKAFGDQKDLDAFNAKISAILEHIEKYNQLTENDIERILGPGGLSILRKVFGVILLAIAVKLFFTNLIPMFEKH